MRKLRLAVATVLLVVACVAVYLATHNRSTIDATVTCPDVNTLRTALGHFNLAQLKLGDVLTASELAGAHYLSSVAIADSTTAQNGKTNLEAASEFVLEIVFSGASPDSTLKAQIKAAIGAQATLKAFNLRRLSVTDPGALFDAHPTVEKRLAAALQRANQRQMNATLDSIERRVLQTHLLVVTSVFSADSVAYSLDNSQSTGTTSNVIAVGEYDVHVNFECKLNLRTRGDAPVFIRFSEYEVRDSKLAHLPRITVNLSNVDFSIADVRELRIIG